MEKRLLLERTIFLGQPINDAVSKRLIGHMQTLALIDPVSPIKFHIKSPGGAVDASLRLFDAMQEHSMEIVTTCFGKSLGSAALILAGGSPGCRHALPAAQIQLLPCSEGNHSASKLEQLDALFASRLAKVTGRDVDEMLDEMKSRRLLSADDAIQLGLIDGIIARG